MSNFAHMKVDILAIGAHPDDIEISCGGTILKHIDLGYDVGIIDLTAGELGTRGSGELRLKEAQAAAKVLGVSFRENLFMQDGFFTNDQQHQLKIIEKIRCYQPKIVLANAPSDRHPDHGRAAQLVKEACFLSGLSKIKTQLNNLEQPLWRPTALYHYIQDYDLKADFVVDISKYFAKKIEALHCFASQFYDPQSNEPETPISSKDFFQIIESKAKVFARYIGTNHAEGFITNRYPGVDNLMELM